MKTNWTTTPIATLPRVEIRDEVTTVYASAELSQRGAFESYAKGYDTGDMEEDETATVRMTVFREDGSEARAEGVIIADGSGGVKNHNLTRWAIEEA